MNDELSFSLIEASVREGGGEWGRIKGGRRKGYHASPESSFKYIYIYIYLPRRGGTIRRKLLRSRNVDASAVCKRSELNSIVKQK